MVKRKVKKKIVNAPDYKSRWGYDDIAWTKYDEADIIPRVSLYDGKGSSVAVNELKKTIKVGKVYKIGTKWDADKKLKAQLVAIYSDPIGFGDPKKKMPVRLKTEWKFLEGNDYQKGRHEIFPDVDIEYRLRSKKRAKIEKQLRRKHGMAGGEKILTELKDLIKQKKLRRL